MVCERELKVAKRVKSSRLFDTQEWARSLKRASMLMWEVRFRVMASGDTAQVS